MRHRSTRQLKKLHRKWLSDVIIDVSQHAYWRRKLFASKNQEEFVLDASDTTGLPANLVNCICKYKLRYSIRVARSSETEPWLSEHGMILFKLSARDFPAVSAFSGNNPDII